MSIRDIDIVIAAILMAVATVLSRITDAAVAMTVLALLVAVAVIVLGEDRLEGLWREYCREPDVAPPRPRKTVPELPARRAKMNTRAPRKMGLAPARVVQRDDRSFIRVA
jgi:hypothetical protein